MNTKIFYITNKKGWGNTLPRLKEIIETMKAYKQKNQTTIIDTNNRLFTLSYLPTFKIKFCGKVDPNKYQPTGKPMKLTQQQHAIFRNIIQTNYPTI